MSTFPIARKDVERCKAALESRTPITITTLVYNKEKVFSGIVQSVAEDRRGSQSSPPQWIVTMIDASSGLERAISAE
jgi:hypothetical protein